MFNWILGAVIVIWLYLLSVLKRTKLDAWLFVVGSAGLFTIAIVVFQPLLLLPMQRSVAFVAGLFGQMTGTYSSYYEKALVFISSPKTQMSLYIDFECSGIIESFAFLALLWFFPAYQLYEKVVVSVIGSIAIFMSNVIRIFVICECLYFFGEDIFFWAHTIIGRFIFYILTIILYFYVFTKSQVVRQKVGAFRYDDN